MALSRALPACSVSRSASSTMRTCQRRTDGASADRRTRSRTSLDPDREALGADDRDVGVGAGDAGVARVAVPAARRLVALQGGGEGAAAAMDRPEPGGPVNSHAWLIARRAARRASACSVVDGAVLADDVATGRVIEPPAPAAAATRSRTAAAISSTGGGRRGRGSGRGRRAASSRNAARTRSWNSGARPRSGRARRRGARARPRARGRGRRSGRAAGPASPQRATRSTSSRPRVAPGALVGERGVDVAVGDAPPRRARAPGGRAVSTWWALSAA